MARRFSRCVAIAHSLQKTQAAKLADAMIRVAVPAGAYLSDKAVG
jgi:hypothetical protein